MPAEVSAENAHVTYQQNAAYFGQKGSIDALFNRSRYIWCLTVCWCLVFSSWNTTRSCTYFGLLVLGPAMLDFSIDTWPRVHTALALI